MLPWKNQTMLAPMEGVTHPELRAIMPERGGLGIVCTEFVRVSRAPLSVRALKREVVKAPGVPLCVQVMGSDVTKMAEAAAVVAAAGADVVDVNLGCPAPKAVRSGAGAAMLKDPAMLFDVLSAMRETVPGLMSAKIRAGFDTADHVVTIAKTVQRAGADYLVVHPRRRNDFYEGVADWRIIRVLADELDIPVVGNGDCWYAADALRMEAETGCAGVMLGRPALRNPWVFRQIAALREGRAPEHPSGAEVFAFLAEVVTRYRAAFPKARHGPVGKIKELLSWIGRAVGDGGVFRKQALRSSSLDEILELAESTLVPLPAERLDLDAWGTLKLERSGAAELDAPAVSAPAETRPATG